MTTQAPVQFACIAKTSVAFLARHRHVDGTYAIPANTESISVKVTTEAGVVAYEGDIDPTAPNLWTELQTADSRWPIDANEGDDAGYNFVWISPLDAFPTQGHYRVEFTFTHTDETVTKLVYEGAARSTNE